MSTKNPAPEVPIRRIDRIIAFTALTLAGLSVISFFAILIGSAAGMGQEDFTGGIWPLAAGIPMWGLPIAFVLIVALLIMSFVRRGRAAKGS